MPVISIIMPTYNHERYRVIMSKITRNSYFKKKQ